MSAALLCKAVVDEFVRLLPASEAGSGGLVADAIGERYLVLQPRTLMMLVETFSMRSSMAADHPNVS